ncbi:hypothetical protein C8Q76DRAFT_598028, partial [Earliella scabrosa]
YDPKRGPACTVTDFRPDLVGSPDTAWNMSVVDVFVQYYTSVNPDADESTVRKLFRGHLKYLGTQYKTSADGIHAMQSRRRASDRADRQRALWVRRLTVAAVVPGLLKHIPMLHRLGPQGMSSDESDHQPDGEVSYRILPKRWRHPALTAWLRIFDYLYRSRHLALSDDIPRRFATGQVSYGPPVRGLPYNAY